MSSRWNTLLLADPPVPLYTPYDTAPFEGLALSLPGHEGIIRSTL